MFGYRKRRIISDTQICRTVPGQFISVASAKRHRPANRAAEGPKTVARWFAASSRCEPLEEHIDLSTITANAASESIRVSRVRRIVIGPAGKT
jgi:hypothetical protein